MKMFTREYLIKNSEESCKNLNLNNLNWKVIDEETRGVSCPIKYSDIDRRAFNSHDTKTCTYQSQPTSED